MTGKIAAYPRITESPVDILRCTTLSNGHNE